MLNRTWRIVLLLIVLILMIWPDLIGTSGSWIALLAVIILLIGEFLCKSCGAPMPAKSSRPAKSVRPAKRRKRRR
jgi:Mg2+/Co2+ transporter CorB